ncbi:hypothetical protein COY27_02610 [Candidatus Woesearchaeota archaeon CG_4_10_14_0_2_um_filter_33_13]|nr:MAG: hypothetical protein COY27_02610 [Candidatus Woesearchaeota archaeon CG_4_10_14_0_2_um_filter_33_13]
MNTELMNWEQCKEEFIREVHVDYDKVRSILKMCAVRLRVLEQIQLDDETASIIAEDYYEIVKEYLTALMLTNGLKSSNHECLVSFFNQKYSDKDYEVKLLYELKKVRNRISYEGFFVDKSYVQRNKLEWQHIIELLDKEIKEKLKSN